MTTCPFCWHDRPEDPQVTDCRECPDQACGDFGGIPVIPATEPEAINPNALRSD